MRLFVGIALSDAVTRELSALVARLRAKAELGDGLRWTEPDSWHITLQFLGNTTPEQYACLMAQLGDVRSAPPLVELGKLGCFHPASVLFVDVAVTPGLAALAERVVAATGRCGFAAEMRPFHPHITLARKTGNTGPREQGNKGAREQGSKNPRSESRNLRDLAAKAGACRFARFTAREFLLYESHLGTGRARYEVRGRFQLISQEGDA
jgi:2'-5' RNA ligase